MTSKKPVLASDVYSQYQLEYLNDTVRKSEWVGRENHIYLHYTDWGTFCAHLQCLSFKKLLKEEKLECAEFPELNLAVYGLSYHSREIREARYDQERPRRRQKYEILLAHGGDEIIFLFIKPPFWPGI